MSNELFRMALRSDISTPAEAAVMLVLADAADDQGVCWPSTERLAEDTRLGRSTVLRALRNLESEGYLSRKRRRAKSSVFTLDRERLGKSQSEKSRSENSQIEKSRCDTPEVPERDGSKENPQRTPTSSRRSPKTNRYTAEFEQWWLLYPKRDGSKGSKFEAFKSWQKALTLTTDAVLTAAVRKYVASQRVRDGYAKDAPTWLNKRCWEEFAGDNTETDHAEWLKGEWRRGRVRDIEARTGLRYTQPDLPPGLIGKAEIEAWLLDKARQWIAANHAQILARLDERRTA